MTIDNSYIDLAAAGFQRTVVAVETLENRPPSPLPIIYRANGIKGCPLVRLLIDRIALAGSGSHKFHTEGIVISRGAAAKSPILVYYAVRVQRRDAQTAGGAHSAAHGQYRRRGDKSTPNEAAPAAVRPQDRCTVSAFCAVVGRTCYRGAERLSLLCVHNDYS